MSPTHDHPYAVIAPLCPGLAVALTELLFPNLRKRKQTDILEPGVITRPQIQITAAGTAETKLQKTVGPQVGHEGRRGTT